MTLTTVSPRILSLGVFFYLLSLDRYEYDNIRDLYRNNQAMLSADPLSVADKEIGRVIAPGGLFESGRVILWRLTRCFYGDTLQMDIAND